MSLPLPSGITVLFALLLGLTTWQRDAAAESIHPSESSLLPPQVASHQMLTNPAKDSRYRASLPTLSTWPGATLWADLRICVSKEGHVRQANVLQSLDPSIDSVLKAMAMTWKYEPYKVNGNKVPYCYILRYEHITH